MCDQPSVAVTGEEEGLQSNGRETAVGCSIYPKMGRNSTGGEIQGGRVKGRFYRQSYGRLGMLAIDRVLSFCFSFAEPLRVSPLPVAHAHVNE